MKRYLKLFISACTVLLFAVQLNLLTSCKDDMPAENYYTFTGEMMSDFLKNNKDFSMYARIVERAKVMDLLSARGEYTLFAPTNDAVQIYLNENNFATVEDIPLEYCDTIAYAHLVNQVYGSNEFADNVTYLNMLEMPLNISTSDTLLDENNIAISVINSVSRVINNLKNDSVENGLVHPIDHLVTPNTNMGGSLLESGSDEFKVYYRALELTGLLDSLDRPYINQDYDVWKEDFPETRDIVSGMQNEKYKLSRPEKLLTGYTIFIVPDRVLKSKYDINIDDPEQGVKDLYNLAIQKYNSQAIYEGLGVTAADKQNYWKDYDEMSAEDLRNTKNPLYIFMAYHILDRFYKGYDKFVNKWGVDTKYADPAEWVNTMLEYSSMKIEAVYRTIDPNVVTSGEIYLNHVESREYTGGVSLKRVPGARVSIPKNNVALNSAYYYLDDVVAYDTDMQTVVMNTRIRTDFMTLFPELTTNDMRLSGMPWMLGGDYDYSGENRYGTNYYIPRGYLKNVKMNQSCIFFIMRPHNTFWNLGGDEVNLLGEYYDFTFRLPSVPTGTYEVRLGFAAGTGTRGIAQIYFDDIPQDIPIDQRIGASDPTIGGIYNDNMTADEAAENKQTMRNNGYFKGPASVYHYHGSEGPNHTVPAPVGGISYFNTISSIYRKVLCTVDLKSNKHHTLRFRSVLSSPNNAAFMMDYIELVPTSICGVGGLGEDDY